MTGPMGRRVRKFDGAFGPEGCGIALWAMSIIMPPFGGHVHIEYHIHSYSRNRVEIIHPSHTTVRTVRYTAVQFLGQIIFS